MYQAKEIGKTERGNKYSILQDSPTSFHVSVDVNNIIRYDHIENPQNKEEILNKILTLENEGLDK